MSSFLRLIPPTYNASFALSSQVEEYEMVHKAYFPVITSIKHLPRKGPQLHAPNDILEIRRIIIFKGFWNIFPYPEEVIRIDRSKLGRQEHDVILESYIDFGFKKEITRLYTNGFFLRR